MTKKKILAAVAGTALVASMAISLTACGPSKLSKTKLNVSDYAVEYKYGSNSNDALTLTKTLTANEDEMVYSNLESYGMCVLNKGTETNPEYTVYSFTYNKNVLTGLKAIPSRYNSTSLVCSVLNGDDTYTRKYYTLDGKEILSINDYTSYGADYSYAINSPVFYSCYVKDETTTSTVNAISATRYDNNTGDESVTIKYYRGVEDEETGITNYEILQLSDIKFYGPEYSAGGSYNGLTRKIYSKSPNYPVEGEITEYSYSVFGDKYTFYRNGEETGNVTIRNGERLAFMGNYMYYYEMEYVSLDSKDYNCSQLTQYSEIKSNYSLYRYDIVKNSAKKLNYNFVTMDIFTLYNYTTKSYDAALVTGYEMVDGVAYSGMNAISYVVDKDMKLAYDLHGADFSSSTSIYDIGDGNYLIGGMIFDSDMNPVNSAANYYHNEKLISFRSGSSYGFTDLSGKIVIEPKYSIIKESDIVFYGGVAYVAELQADGSSKAAFLKADGSVRYVDDLVKSSNKSEEKDINVNYGFYTITTETPSSEKVAYYTYGGTLLKEFDLSVCSLTNTSIGNDAYIVETASNVANYYKLG